MTQDRKSLTAEQRLELLERDARDHAKSLSDIIQAISHGFTPEQLQQLRGIFHDAQADAGLRVDGPDHVAEARADFRFVRKMRGAWEGAANKIGNSILMAVIAIVAVIVALGFWSWIGKGGG